MTPEQLQQQIDELKSEVLSLKEYIDNDRFLKNTDALKYKSLTAGSPSTNGHITVEINGINRNIMTTA